MNSLTKTDVFVVGGGPAGLAAAIAARRKGFDVTVADGAAPPIEKACGEGMMPDTLVALRELGVKVDRSEGSSFRGICFAQEDARVYGEFPDGAGVGLRRTALHARLIARAVECGVKCLWQTPVLAIGPNFVEIPSQRVSTNWIIGADGQESRVRRWNGFQTKHVRRRFATRRHFAMRPWSEYVEVHWSSSAQAYVTPVGEEEVCVVILAGTPELASFDRAIREFPELRARISGVRVSSRERGGVTAMRSLRSVYRGNVALVGDASGGVDAITGEGIRLGLHHALALADAIAAGTLDQYQRAHQALAVRPERMGQLMLWLDRNPKIRARAIRALQSEPKLFSQTIAMHVGRASPQQVVSTGAHLGWRFLAA